MADGGGGALLQVRSVRLRFGGVVALDDVTFDVRRGELCALVGPNGAGKTSLFNCVSGLYRPQSGAIAFGGADLLRTAKHRRAALGLARTFQELALFPTLSVLDNVVVGTHVTTAGGWSAGAVRTARTRRTERRARQRAGELLDLLGLAHLAARPAAGLPYGTLKRVELARALACEPTLLLLDEPVAGLSADEVEQLGALLQSVRTTLGLTVLLIEHHMAFVMAISDRVVVLEHGRVLTEGTPAQVSSDPAVLAAYLGVAP